MHSSWKDFLSAQHAQIAADGDVVFNGSATSGLLLFPLTHLSVLAVSGTDAAKFLQGQLTCDVNAISASHGGMGAFCTPKGRTIATFLIAKQADAFLLVLPTVLAEIVQSRLQRYILRSAVTISDGREAYALLGIEGMPEMLADYPLPQQAYGIAQAGSDMLLAVPVAPPRCILLASTASAPAHWNALRNRGFEPANTALWRSRDISAGIPWLDTDSSEQFIPQMLNLDRLGGIGFSKGCYTGQEIVARTQYLGEVKRRLYYAECAAEAEVTKATAIVDSDAENDTATGKLLVVQRHPEGWQVLAVLQTASAASKNLRLQNRGQDKISVKALHYITDAAD